MERPKIPDQRFHEELRRSDLIVDYVNVWLRTKGWTCKPNPMRVTPDYESRHEYTDDGDIMVLDYWTFEPIGRIEVKHWPHIDFKCKKTVPYRMVFVDEVYQIQRDHSLPLMGYVIVNQSVTHAILIPEDTRKHWQVVKKTDSRYGVELEWLACPKHLVHIRKLHADE